MHSTMPVAALTLTGTVLTPSESDKQNQLGQALALPAVADERMSSYAGYTRASKECNRFQYMVYAA
jgi:hypothetical protein